MAWGSKMSDELLAQTIQETRLRIQAQKHVLESYRADLAELEAEMKRRHKPRVVEMPDYKTWRLANKGRHVITYIREAARSNGEPGREQRVHERK